MDSKEGRFKTAIESNKDRIYRLCCCYVPDPDERKDVYQEVLIHIWQSLDSFEGKSEISTWIYRIAVNSCLGYLRAERRRKRIFDGNADLRSTEVPDQGQSDVGGNMDADVQKLYDAIGQLEPVERALISLYLEDVSTRDMAAIFGISEVNVRVRLHRVKGRLKEMLEVSEHESGQDEKPDQDHQGSRSEI